MRAHSLFVLFVAAVAVDAAGQVPVASGATSVQTSPGHGTAVTTTIVSARIVAVDASSRRLDVQLADGRLVGLIAGSEVRRLAELAPGDVVNVAYVQSLVLELRREGAPVVARRELAGDVRRNPSSAAPGGVAQSEVTVVADVLAVDAANRTLTLRGPNRTVDVRLNDPAQVALVRPGDQVEATYTEAVAVSVEPGR